MSFVKRQIIDELANTYTDFRKKDLEKALNVVLEEIINSLSEGKNVEIRGFGSFKIRHLKPRTGRNPRDGSKIEIPARRSVHWKMSKKFLQKLNVDLNQNE